MSDKPENPRGKVDYLTRELTAEINAGRHGAPGARFMSTRQLVADRQVALKTAHLILQRLCRYGVLELRGRRYFLSGIAPGGIRRRKIGLLLTRLDTDYFAKLAARCEELAREYDCELTVAASNYSLRCESDALARLTAANVSGILTTPWGIELDGDLYRTLRIPYVLIGRKVKNVSADAVTVDNLMAARQVAEHLVEIGCRGFAYVGPGNLPRDQRLAGFRAGLLENGAELGEGAVILWRDEAHEHENFRRFLRTAERRLGIFCYTDLFAARVLQICHEEGMAIPNDAAVAGFDDLALASELYPPLTTVRYPIDELARSAFEVLLGKIDRAPKSEGTTRYLESKLIVRGSTDPEWRHGFRPLGIRN